MWIQKISRLGSLFAAASVALPLLSGCRTDPLAQSQATWTKSWHASTPVWRGVHLGINNNQEAGLLLGQLPRLADNGVNLIVVEVNYNFQFQSHPEVKSPDGLTRDRARELARASREHGIRLVPQLNCLGHQSWSKTTLQLLTSHPEFDETPRQFPENQGIYCRSWCPQHPDVNKVVFALIDELIEAFEADAFHVGMDEVFLLASEHCPRCRGGDPAKLFAKAVNDLHRHIAGERKIDMLMWGDRLLDAKALGFSEWEASKNNTAPAVDLIPKDIIICDWHYGKQEAYPSVPFLLGKGFRVFPSGWKPLEATKAFSNYALTQKNARLLGYLCTTWGEVRISEAADWPPLKEVLRDWK